ncbi:MAG: PAC2 family protein [Chloroflexi bacterium]|nr:PAC2 family protein [Chloroflexota bacterium]
MADSVDFRERPEAQEIVMIAGWRQWADGGSVSSGLPLYLVQHTKARRIGTMKPDGFYLFQIPGTHDLVRPVVKFDEGYPRSLETQRNEFYYTGDSQRGVVIFLGDEPHMDIERYVAAILDAAQSLGVKRIVGLGGVYGELPYDKERMISSNYSLPALKEPVRRLAVNLSDYEGGASIGSVVCKRAGERGLEYVGLYAFVPAYDFSNFTTNGSTIRLENDFMAWLGVMKRANYWLKTSFDLSDLEEKAGRVVESVEAKVDELDSAAPHLGIRDYMQRLSDEFTEVIFDPLDDVWGNELRRILGDSEGDGE